MTTLQIQLSDSLLAQIKQTADNGDTNSFVVEAINRYLKIGNGKNSMPF